MHTALILDLAFCSPNPSALHQAFDSPRTAPCEAPLATPQARNAILEFDRSGTLLSCKPQHLGEVPLPTQGYSVRNNCSTELAQIARRSFLSVSSSSLQHPRSARAPRISLEIDSRRHASEGVICVRLSVTFRTERAAPLFGIFRVS